MAENNQDPSTKAESDFAQAAQPVSGGFVRDFVDFLLHNKKWWLAPIIIVLLLVGLLVVLGGTPVAPFIYALF